MYLHIALTAAAAALILPATAASAAEGHGHHNWGKTTTNVSTTNVSTAKVSTANPTSAKPREYAEADATCFFENRWVKNASGERIFVKARVCY